MELDWKGLEFRGRGKATLFLGCPSSCSERGRAIMADPAEGKLWGGWQWWPAVLRSGSSPWHILSELGGREAWNFKRIFCFVLVFFCLWWPGLLPQLQEGLLTVSLFGEKFITQVHCILCWQTLPPRSPQTWYNRVPYKDPASTVWLQIGTMGVCLSGLLLLWKLFAKILRKDGFSLFCMDVPLGQGVDTVL